MKESGVCSRCPGAHCNPHPFCPPALQIDLQSSAPPLLDDSLTVPETCSVKKEDEFLTASQNSVLLTSDQTGGNP